MDSPLGKRVRYADRYDPDLLVSLSRSETRDAMGMGDELPFVGEDVWNGYEFSWLNERGLPRVAGLRIRVDAASPAMVESKSMKLYLNGFAQTRYPSAAAVREVLAGDLARAFGTTADVALYALSDMEPATGRLPGMSLDQLNVAVHDYRRNPALLAVDDSTAPVAEALHTHLFRSLCPVTGQPDWASLVIDYAGPPMDRAGLLRYLVSYRGHQAFHEATVEQIFIDLKARCRCERLLVAGRFLRRGGLDINPLRADQGELPAFARLPRQ